MFKGKMQILIFLVLFASHSGILQLVRSYEKALEMTYSHTEGIAAVMEAAGHRYNP